MCTTEKFLELYKLNVNEHIEKKPSGSTQLSYLSWSWAWAEFKKKYPNATYNIKKDSENRCYFGDERIGYMVYTEVTADDLTYEMWLPVMDSNNKAMKLEAYEYTTKFGKKRVEAMSMFDVNKTVMRCLVKNLAMFGLGLYIYAGDDLPEADDEAPVQKPAETPKKATKKTASAPAPVPVIEKLICDECLKEITDFTFKGKDGKDKTMTAQQVADRSRKTFDACLCVECASKRKEAK